MPSLVLHDGSPSGPYKAITSGHNDTLTGLGVCYSSAKCLLNEKWDGINFLRGSHPRGGCFLLLQTVRVASFFPLLQDLIGLNQAKMEYGGLVWKILQEDFSSLGFCSKWPALSGERSSEPGRLEMCAY